MTESAGVPTFSAGPVLVGDDGSAGSRAAVEWAHAYAADMGVRSQTRTVDPGEGSPALGLLTAAEEARAPLLVVGRRGAGGFADLALGSTAHQVAERSSRPVAIVPPGTTERRPVASRVLVGIDGSDAGMRAATWAAGFCAAIGARVTAVHALDIAPALMAIAPDADAYSGALATRVQVFENEWARPLRDAGVELDTVTEEGGAAGVLVSVATERAADLVVVGRRSVKSSMMVMGSAAHRVVAYAPCPVVVVPETS